MGLAIGLSGILCPRGKQGRVRWTRVRQAVVSGHVHDWSSLLYRSERGELVVRASKKEKQSRETGKVWIEARGEKGIAICSRWLPHRALWLPLYSPSPVKPSLLHSVCVTCVTVFVSLSCSIYLLYSPHVRLSSLLLPPGNLSTSGQPHLPGCPQDINRTQRLVSVYPRPLTHCRVRTRCTYLPAIGSHPLPCHFARYSNWTWNKTIGVTGWRSG